MKPWSVVGHDWAVQQLRHAVAQDDAPHALLITGPQSVGKQTLAQQLVSTLLCRAEAADDRPCGTCLSCRKLTSGNHPDHLAVAPEDAKARLKIERIREVERFLALTPIESPCKVALIGDFERATIGAANALLKTLEEPPSYAHIILLATDADLLLPTIVSRAQQIVLRPLPSRLIADALVDRWDVEPGLAARLARISGGRMGWAVRAATEPGVYERMQGALERLVTVLGEALPARFVTAKEMAKERDALTETLEIWLTLWRDVLLLHLDGGGALTHRDHRRIIEVIVRGTDVGQVVGVLTALDDAQSALTANANAQLLVENLLLNLPAVDTDQL